jgi:hypothetical protein
MRERSADRKLGSAVEIAEVFKEFATPAEVLGAATLALGKLEDIVAKAILEVKKATGERLTKKAASEMIHATLDAHGLITRPDGKIRFLKLVKSAVPALPEPPKQITQ